MSYQDGQYSNFSIPLASLSDITLEFFNSKVSSS